MTCSVDTNCATHVITPEFRSLLDGFELELLDAQESTIYGVDRDLKIGYTNATWTRFGRRNNAPEALLTPHNLLRKPLLEFISGPVTELYEVLLRYVLDSGETYQQEYECSTPRIFRLFRMTIHPLPIAKSSTEGLLIINSLAVQDDLPEQTGGDTVPDASKYISRDGQLVMCSNCRRIRHNDDNERWDWVPTYLESAPAPISHGLCQVCLDYYYQKPESQGT